MVKENRSVLVSAVVPVYNAEKYLKSCVDSILEQSFENFELILVDDGSFDRSGEICDEYKDKDLRVRVIHQVNKGSVQARLAGVENAIGKYLVFIDSDDWIEKELFENAVRQLECTKAEIFVYGFVEENGILSIPREHAIESGVYESEQLTELKKRALYSGHYYEYGIAPALWNKFFDLDFFRGEKPEIDVKLNNGDDIAFTYPLINASRKMVIDNDFKPYHYRVLAASLCRRYDAQYFLRQDHLIDILRDNLMKSVTDNAIWKRQIDVFMCNSLILGIMQELGNKGCLSYSEARQLCKTIKTRVVKCECVKIECNCFNELIKISVLCLNKPIVYWIFSRLYWLRSIIGKL